VTAVRNDPYERWLIRLMARPEIDPEIVWRSESIAHDGLQKLDAALDNPPPKGLSYYDAAHFAFQSFSFHPDDLPWAHNLYHRIFSTPGTGSTYTQEEFLNLIAQTGDPASIPFWIGLLELMRRRDNFATTRKTMAVAALACLAVTHKSRETYAALRQLLEFPKEEVRALALFYLGRTHEVLKRLPTSEVLREVRRIAEHDPAFAPRFQARRLLQGYNKPISLDNQGCAYAFRIKFRRAKSLLQRTIELRSEQTLADLAHAINHSLNWDMDHLYSFYMNGELHDEQYRFSCPYEDDRPPWTDEAVIGELGLTLKHKFVYYFDYGDSHEFEVEVVGIAPTAEKVKYPRVVVSKGEAPEQYSD
jgi:hypothetical protein